MIYVLYFLTDLMETHRYFIHHLSKRVLTAGVYRQGIEPPRLAVQKKQLEIDLLVLVDLGNILFYHSLRKSRINCTGKKQTNYHIYLSSLQLCLAPEVLLFQVNVDHYSFAWKNALLSSLFFRSFALPITAGGWSKHVQCLRCLDVYFNIILLAFTQLS